MAKYLDWGGLLTFWSKIKSWVGDYAKITIGDNKSIEIGENTITPIQSITAGVGLNTTGNDSSSDGGTIGIDSGQARSGTINLTKSGVTAGSYGLSSNATPAAELTFNVPYITVDKYGRVTAASTKTVTIPAAPSSFNISVTDNLLDGTGGANSVGYAPYSSKGAGHLYTGTTDPTNNNRLNYDGYLYATNFGGKFNDLTLTKATTGFTIAGGTTSKTLTVNNSYTLAAACAKGVVTSISSDSADLPTVTAVKNYVTSQMSSVVGALVYKGTVSAESSLLNTALSKGWYYIVTMPDANTTSISIGGSTCEAGDMVIVNEGGTYTTSSALGLKIDVVQSNIYVITDSEINSLT